MSILSGGQRRREAQSGLCTAGPAQGAGTAFAAAELNHFQCVHTTASAQPNPQTVGLPTPLSCSSSSEELVALVYSASKMKRLKMYLAEHPALN